MFDLLGLTGPITNKSWDFYAKTLDASIVFGCSLARIDSKEMSCFISLLSSTESINIPRCFVNKETVIIHGFSDASTSAYGVVVYSQCISSNKAISVHLLRSKSGVTTVKPLTIPRLELCAALLLSQLLRKVRQSLNFSNSKTILWIDSTIVISWLENSPHELKTFIDNRISMIRGLCKVSE